jgi:hypothetical protein
MLNLAHHFPQLLQQDEGGLGLHFQVAAEVERTESLRTIDEKRDGEQNVAMLQLASGKDGAGRG